MSEENKQESKPVKQDVPRPAQELPRVAEQVAPVGPQLFFRYPLGGAVRLGVDGELLFDTLMGMMGQGSAEQMVMSLTASLYKQVMQATAAPEVSDGKHN